MKTTFTVLAAAFAMVAAAPRSNDQGTTNMTVATNAPSRPDTMSAAGIALPDSTTLDTLKKIASVNKETKKVSSFMAMAPKVEIQNYRPEDKRGINMFEAPKDESVAYDGFKLQWGAAFTQQFQGLDHSNTASPRLVTTGTPPVTTDANQLIRIGHGPNNATANLYLNGQLARGIRVAMTTYSSARHHNETWVKDGYLLVDASPIDWKPLNDLMKYVTIRAGHFEINYGDAHFRRSDNGNAIRNALVGNYIMDAFTTEVGGEVYLRANGFMLMGGVTGGESRGMITSPEKRSPSYLMKAGFDRTFENGFRFRLTGSEYATSSSVANTLFSGDRAGSRYYDVLENTSSTESAQAWSGAMQPGLKNSIHSWVVNPFLQFKGLEFFGNVETAKGRAAGETANRTWKQNVGEVVYRFLPDQRVFLAARYNTVKGQLTVGTPDVTVNRSQVGGGWFLTPNVLTKLEFVNQKYLDFPTTDIRHAGQFKGFMVEGV
ncbi:MAG TPA: hypothetical protein VLJ83_08920, partial [Gemmatimonadaceae bacterium]|nr:hypothetical protein [Gemmatimonadaceae bacterium]